MKLLEVMQMIECEVVLGVTIHLKDAGSTTLVGGWHASCGNLEIKCGESLLGSCVGFGDTALQALKALARAMSCQTLIAHAADPRRRKEWSLPCVRL